MAFHFHVISRFILHQISYHSTLYFCFFFFLLCGLLFSCHFPFYPPPNVLSFDAIFLFLLPVWRFLLSVVASPITFPQPSVTVTAALQFHIWSKYTVFFQTAPSFLPLRFPTAFLTPIYLLFVDTRIIYRYSVTTPPGLKMLKVSHHHAKYSANSTLY